MHLIHVDTVTAQGERREARTWLVIADTLFAAMSLVPAVHRAIGAAVQPGAVSGPGRVIGWLGPPPWVPARPIRQAERKAEFSGEAMDRKPMSGVGGDVRLSLSARKAA